MEDYGQLSIFDFMYEKYKITKPIRLIELFAGIGSQAKALKLLGANFETYKIVEFDKYAIKSYNAVHNTSFETLDITKISASDLDIIDTNKYEYIMTYSFPCQDLSLAGKGKGMKKDSGTRSGLLWQVERLLDELFDRGGKKSLPQILVMENVPQVIGQKNIKDFQNWGYKLESFGYSNYVEVINSKDYGIPQNRERCFMVSILGEYSYKFPRKLKLQYFLKDFIDENVDEKYYLSQKMIDGMIKTNFEIYKLENKLKDINGCADTIITRYEGNPQVINVKEATKKGYAEAHEGDGVYINRPHQKRGVVQEGRIQTLKTSPDVGVVIKVGNYSPSGHNASTIVDVNGIAPTVMENHGTVTAIVNKNTPKLVGGIGEKKSNGGTQYYQQDRVYSSDGVAMCHPANLPGGSYMYQLNNLRIRKLTPKECWRLMGFTDEDFEKAEKVNSNAQLYKQAGNSIVTTCLMGIFGELLDIDYTSKIKQLARSINDNTN